MVLLFNLFYLLIMLVLRCLISLSPIQHQPRKSVYTALYFMPALTVAHAIFAGLICKYCKRQTSYFAVLKSLINFYPATRKISNVSGM